MLSIFSVMLIVLGYQDSYTDILAYSDTAYSDSLATVTLLASPKSFINRVSL